jgi:hypothetical protein
MTDREEMLLLIALEKMADRYPIYDSRASPIGF